MADLAVMTSQGTGTVAEPTGEREDDCDICAVPRAWRLVTGPDAIAARLLAMLDLVDSGFGTPPLPEPVPPLPSATPWTPTTWTDLPREDVTADLVRVGPPWGVDLPSRLTVVCPRCGTTFTVSWVYDRGYARWTVGPAC